MTYFNYEVHHTSLLNYLHYWPSVTITTSPPLRKLTICWWSVLKLKATVDFKHCRLKCVFSLERPLLEHCRWHWPELAPVSTSVCYQRLTFDRLCNSESYLVAQISDMWTGCEVLSNAFPLPAALCYMTTLRKALMYKKYDQHNHTGQKHTTKGDNLVISCILMSTICLNDEKVEHTWLFP